jgi:hypothetical protein
MVGAMAAMAVILVALILAVAVAVLEVTLAMVEMVDQNLRVLMDQAVAVVVAVQVVMLTDQVVALVA